MPAALSHRGRITFLDAYETAADLHLALLSNGVEISSPGYARAKLQLDRDAPRRAAVAIGPALVRPWVITGVGVAEGEAGPIHITLGVSPGGSVTIAPGQVFRYVIILDAAVDDSQPGG